MNITHYDLFAGIGGFSLALDTVFHEQKNKHIFCEWEAFPTAVLKKHWPDGTYYGDIADLVADTASEGLERSAGEKLQGDSNGLAGGGNDLTILTGGFPCQPFSHAGRRQGTADDRYLWPPMLEVIRNVKPDWVIAENVRGLVTWNDGMVLETVCADLESEGYEVQPLVIPAVAIGAPHRRDRVWIVGCRNKGRITSSGNNGLSETEINRREKHQPNNGTEMVSQFTAASPTSGTDFIAPNPRQQLREQGSGERVEASTTIGTTSAVSDKRSNQQSEQLASDSEHQRPVQCEHEERPRREEALPTLKASYTWATDWREVAFATCHDSVDDGLPRRMGGVTISGARHRKESLKAYGNAIVPQVAMEIFTAIKSTPPPIKSDER